MKNYPKFIGTFAFVAVIGLLVTACPDTNGGSGDGLPTHTHQWGAWAVTTAATCITAGEKIRTCALDATHKETEAIPIDTVSGHDWGEWTGTVTCTTAGQGTRVCVRNSEHTETENLAALGHNYQNWITTTAPTCTATGEEAGTCTRDVTHTDTRAVAINPNAHDWNNNYTVTTPATCMATGIETDTCTHNATHARTQTVAINPNAHNWNNNYTVTTPATCTATGIETDTCTHNATHTRTQTVAIDPNAHNYQNWITTTAPTCTATGIEAGTCSRNSSHTTTRTGAINPNAHDYGNWTQTTTPTPAVPGIETGTCTRDATHPVATRPKYFMEMVWIDGGTFTMGSYDSQDSNASPAHTVTLTQGFYMGRYEVTQEQYLTVMGTNPSYFTSSPASGEVQNRRPVERVSWYDALVFCNKLSMLEGLTPAYRISNSTDPSDWGTVPTSSNTTWNAVQIVSGSTGYRLPTEAQWEYACRAGTGTAYNTGATISNDTGWYSDNSNSMTHEVGKKPANAWGLYDMHGNVWEWCWDWYGTYSSGAQTDPTGAASGTDRLVRGGAWNLNGRYARSAFRSSGGSYPSIRSNDLGFRLVRP